MGDGLPSEISLQKNPFRTFEQWVVDDVQWAYVLDEDLKN
jgi:hypothetical protein